MRKKPTQAACAASALGKCQARLVGIMDGMGAERKGGEGEGRGVCVNARCNDGKSAAVNKPTSPAPTNIDLRITPRATHSLSTPSPSPHSSARTNIKLSTLRATPPFANPLPLRPLPTHAKVDGKFCFFLRLLLTRELYTSPKHCFGENLKCSPMKNPTG